MFINIYSFAFGSFHNPRPKNLLINMSETHGPPTLREGLVGWLGLGVRTEVGVKGIESTPHPYNSTTPRLCHKMFLRNTQITHWCFNLFRCLFLTTKYRMDATKTKLEKGQKFNGKVSSTEYEMNAVSVRCCCSFFIQKRIVSVPSMYAVRLIYFECYAEVEKMMWIR